MAAFVFPPQQKQLFAHQRNHMTAMMNNYISRGGWLAFKKALVHVVNVITATIWALFAALLVPVASTFSRLTFLLEINFFL